MGPPFAAPGRRRSGRCRRERATAGQATTARAGGSDADALFKAGEFEQADRAYEEILKTDPTNVHAARQRGYVGLLSNRFPEAEKYLTMALKLAPSDKETNQLACEFVSQLALRWTRTRSRPLSRDRTRCPRCPASRCTNRCRHTGVARVPRRGGPAVRIQPRARPGALPPRARYRLSRQDAPDS
jgi:tetratricopeptide (TPR) repeat protein